MTDSLRLLVTELTRARNVAAGLFADPVAGVRALEPAPGRRWYLCASQESGFLCLDRTLEPERDRRQAREAVMCALLVEHAESLVDAAELELVATLATRVRSLVQADLGELLDELSRASGALAGWRADPRRAVASVPDLDRAMAFHERLRRAYEAYLAASEPLVAEQDRLAPGAVAALRDLEETAGRAGLTGSLGAQIGEAMPAIDAGVREILDAHLTPLRDD